MLHPVNVPIVGFQHCDFRRAKLSDGQISLVSPIKCPTILDGDRPSNDCLVVANCGGSPP